MYKQARQLMLMKQTMKKDAEVNAHQLSAELKHVLKVRDEPVLEVRKDEHGECCNLLVAVVTLVVLLAVSQQTVKLPQDPVTSLGGAMQFLPALTIPPTLSEDGPAVQLLENQSEEELEKPSVEAEKSCDVPLEPENLEAEKSCDVLADGDSPVDEFEDHDVAEEQHASEAGPNVNMPSVASAEEAQAGDDGPDELPEGEDNGNMDDKEVSEKNDDQDEVSSCVSSCGTSDGYEKLEIGGSIFMDEEEDAKSVTCT
jgi:hypothetical protein